MVSVSNIIKRVRKTMRRPKRYPVVYNVNGADESLLRKRALLAYVIAAFTLPENAPEFLMHQNLKQCKQIAALLGEFGYIVDVVDVRDQRFVPDRSYDLVMRDRIRLNHWEPAPTGTIRILLATTMDHRVHNQNLRKRQAALVQRRGPSGEIKRLFSEHMAFATEADAIIGFGNEYILGTWKRTSKARTYAFNNYGFSGTQFIYDSRDFNEARKNFLFFASGSQLQKGLDLLLEIFSHLPELHLYVCSAYDRGKEAEFRACYHKELFETPNIHAMGWIEVNGPEFYELARRCAYVISASCSEGQSGSVVQCMHTGLIPVVTRETGIDTEDFGLTFADDSLKEIERVVVELANLPEAWHREHSLKTRKVSEEKYSEAAFIARWRQILSEVLPGGE